MATTTRCRRVARRFSIPADREASIRFVHPSPQGRTWELSLLDLSLSGLSFVSDEPVPGLETGMTLGPVRLCLGRVEIEGEVLLMHVTRRDDARQHCGALFYPAADEDLIKLKSVMAGIEAVYSD